MKEKRMFIEKKFYEVHLYTLNPEKEWRGFIHLASFSSKARATKCINLIKKLFSKNLNLHIVENIYEQERKTKSYYFDQELGEEFFDILYGDEWRKEHEKPSEFYKCLKLK